MSKTVESIKIVVEPVKNLGFKKLLHNELELTKPIVRIVKISMDVFAFHRSATISRNAEEK